MKTQNYETIKTAIRYWLLGRGYTVAYTSMEYAKHYHNGFRKDGVTPEFQHQISQMNFARTLDKILMHPEETYATIAMHDLVEDTSVTLVDVEHMLVNDARATDKQVARILRGVELMTNQVDGVKKELVGYYLEMIEDPIASIAKGCDRMHNHQSMGGVFSIKKQESYIQETDDHILPMLKSARKRWVEQEPAYENIKHVLLTQMELVTQIIEASTSGEAC